MVRVLDAVVMRSVRMVWAVVGLVQKLALPVLCSRSAWCSVSQSRPGVMRWWGSLGSVVDHSQR